MSRVDVLEQAVRSLKPDELAAFRRWFAEFDGAVWDAQIEADVKAGRLDALAERALDVVNLAAPLKQVLAEIGEKAVARGLTEDELVRILGEK